MNDETRPIHRRRFLRSLGALFSSVSIWPRFAKAAGLYNVGAFWQKVGHNQLWVWGLNTYGQFGLGNRISYSSPVQVPGSWAQVDSAWTYSTSAAFSLGIRTDGTLWSWGDNTYGELGQGTHGTSKDQSSPVQIAGSWTQIACGGQNWNNPFALGIRIDGSLWAWGDNSLGTLGQGNTTLYSSPVQIMAGTTWKYVGRGYWNWFAIQTNGTLWACGAQGAGELGTGQVGTGYNTPVQIQGSWIQAMCAVDGSAGGSSIGIKSDGSLWGWGGNADGDLGHGDLVSYSSPVQIGTASWTQAMLSGASAGVGIRTDGTLWAWGNNSGGNLGQGDQVSRSSPVQIPGQWRSVFTQESSDNNGYTIAIRADGTLWSWGDNNAGNLGLGNKTNYLSPVQVGTGTWSAISGGANTVMLLK